MKEKKQGKSIKKRILRVLFYGIMTFLSLPLVLTFLLKQPLVQSMAARKITAWISEKTHDSLTIEVLDIDLLKGIEIKHLHLNDSTGKTMLSISRLHARPAFFRLLYGQFLFHSISMDTVDFRLIQHKGDADYSFIHFINKLSSGENSSKPAKAFKMKIRYLELAHVHFQLKNENGNFSDTLNNTMNYNNINVTRAFIVANNFFLVNDSLGFHLDNLTAHERSGLFLKRMQSDVIISGRYFSFKNTRMAVNHSTLNFDYSMLSNGWPAYSDFIDSVKMSGNFRHCNLDMSDIGYFAGVMFQMKDKIKILGGRITGPVSRLCGKNLNVKYGKSTHFKGNVSMNGLPDFCTTNIHAAIKHFETSTADLRNFAIPGNSLKIPVPKSLALKQKFKVTGQFTGSYYNFFTKDSIITANNGSLNMKIKLMADTGGIHQLTAHIQAQNFPLNNFINADSLMGETDFKAYAHVFDTLNKQNAYLRLHISRIRANGYTFRNIQFHGHYLADTLFSNLKINDPHLILSSTGYSVLKKNPVFHFRLNLARSDFKPLHLWRRKDFHLRGLATINFSGLDADSLSGNVFMKNAVVRFGKDKYPVSSVHLVKKWTNSGKQTIDFKSDLFNFYMTGHYRLASVSTAIGKLFNHYFPVLPKNHQILPSGNQSVRFTLLLKKPEFLGEHFIYDLNISPDTRLTAFFNLKNNTLEANGYARKFIYHGIKSIDNNLRIMTVNHKLKIAYDIRHLILRDSTATDKTVFGLDNLRLKLGLRNDSLAYGIFWNNPDTVWVNKGLLKGYYIDDRTKQQFNISRSKVYVNDTLWHINPQNKIIHSKGAWQFHKVFIRGGLSKLALQGNLPKKNGDSLSIDFHNWNLSNLDLLWHMMGFDIDGTLNGDMKITRVDNRNARIADLTIKKLALNHTSLGNARILSTWNNTDYSAFIKAQVLKQTPLGRKKIMDLTGFYYPYRDTANLNLSLDFNNLKLKAINPFFNEYISRLKGTAQGKMTLTGSTKNPLIEGYVNVKNASLVVNYLNTKYYFHQKIYFDKNEINFGKMILYDTLGNQAVVQGKILHNYFRDMRMDISINTNKFLFFNTSRHMNNIYYGTAIASGKVSITGPINNIKLNIDAKTDKGTSVILPLDYSTEIADKNYIIFKPPPAADSLRKKPKETVLKMEKTEQSRYAVSLNMNIRPSADVKIYLPSNMGNIQSEGSGLLNLNVDSEGDLSLTGDYVVDNGEFNFSLGNLIKKHFELVKGGRISWSGNPYQATVNIKGLYKLKTNLSSLGIVIDSTANYKNRTQVNCYVIMSHDLFNPDIKFQIHFPDLDPDMQRMVYAQLDTTNTAVMNQQMISLLVLGSFSLSNNANINWSTSYYTILSNQLSSMLSKISKDFDIGINYKPGDALTKKEFDVALSTQLFDNRLIINGNLGMTYDKQNKSANNLVGDVDIQYKLTKDGRWMLKAYNHSNVNSWYYYSNYDKISPYTQGFGIVYNRDFNSLADLFRKRGKRKKKSPKTTKKTKK